MPITHEMIELIISCLWDAGYIEKEEEELLTVAQHIETRYDILGDKSSESGISEQKLRKIVREEIESVLKRTVK